MRILGLDVGSSSIKAVELDSAFGRYDIHDYHEVAIEAGSTPEKSVQKLISQLPKAPDRIIVSLPQRFSTFRNLNLPTRDKKAIQSGIKFELEDELPFSPEIAAFDYAIVSQTKQGSSVHVSATLKAHVTKMLEFWGRSGVDPDLMSTDAWAYRTLFNRIIPPTESQIPILFIRIARESSTFYVHWKGTPILARQMNWGGRDLTQAIAEKFQIPEAQAETIKLDQGTVCEDDPDAKCTLEQKDISLCLEGALETLLAEIKRMEIACKSLTTQKPKALYLGGGGALLPGLGKWIESRIQTPTKLLPALSSITTSGVTYSPQTDARFILALSLSLCLVGADRALCINFRKGDFSKEVRSRELNVQVLKKPFIAVGIVASCLFLSLIVQSAVYKNRLATTNTQLERSVRSFFGQLSNSALKTYLSNTSTLKSSIQKELNKQRELSKLFGPNPRSPLEFLKTLSNAVPKDVIVDLMTFQNGVPPAEPFSTKERPSVALTFAVNNPQIAEKLTNIIGSKIEDFHKGKMEEVSSPQEMIKKWKITYTGKLEDRHDK